MRVVALMIRILRQLVRDKRTLGLLIFAPILVLTMLHLVFNSGEYVPRIGLVELPSIMAERFNFEQAEAIVYERLDQAKLDLKDRKLDAYLSFDNGEIYVTLEGSDPSVAGSTLRSIQAAMTSGQPIEHAPQLNIQYLHGSDEMGLFDYFGPVLLGFFIFFFVFLIAGISFLRERTTGTLERLMSSPLRRWEVVIGYVSGFSVFTMIQSIIIAAYAIYVLGMAMEGSFGYVLLITLLLALTALTLGILLSSFATTELQMMQFIPIIVIPQIFFSGLFNLDAMSEWISWVAPITPLYYAAEALRDVMVRGYGWNQIYLNISVLVGFSLLFMTLNILALRRVRKF